MANKDLRNWISEIEAAGELKIIRGAEPKQEIGRLAAREGIALSSLGASSTALEAAFLRLTEQREQPASAAPITAHIA